VKKRQQRTEARPAPPAARSSRQPEVLDRLFDLCDPKVPLRPDRLWPYTGRDPSKNVARRFGVVGRGPDLLSRWDAHDQQEQQSRSTPCAGQTSCRVPSGQSVEGPQARTAGVAALHRRRRRQKSVAIRYPRPRRIYRAKSAKALTRNSRAEVGPKEAIHLLRMTLTFFQQTPEISTEVFADLGSE